MCLKCNHVSIAFAARPEGYLRQTLAKAGVDESIVDVPLQVDLELKKYLDERGEKKLKGCPELEFKDPMGIQEKCSFQLALTGANRNKGVSTWIALDLPFRYSASSFW